MRILNKGLQTKVLSLADGTKVHIYPGLEEDIPDKVYYKTLNVIKRDIDLRIIKETKKEVKPKIKKYNNEELYKMNKDAQVKLLKRYGVNSIPKYEKDRVKKILEMQNGI